MAAPRPSWVERFIILWIVRHGGEWPDWGHGPEGPYAEAVNALAIHEMAGSISDKAARKAIRDAAARVVAEVGQKGLR